MRKQERSRDPPYTGEIATSEQISKQVYVAKRNLQGGHSPTNTVGIARTVRINKQVYIAKQNLQSGRAIWLAIFTGHGWNSAYLENFKNPPCKALEGNLTWRISKLAYREILYLENFKNPPCKARGELTRLGEFQSWRIVRFSRLLTARHRREFDVIFKEHAKPRSCSQMIEEETVEEERFCRRHTNAIETDCWQSTWITPRACCGDTLPNETSKGTLANKYIVYIKGYILRRGEGLIAQFVPS